MSNAPAISVVVETESFAMIRETMRALAAQTIAGQVELVAVAPAAEQLGPGPPEAAALFGVRVVENPLRELPSARAAGIRSAAAPLVLIGETHAFPLPGALEALVERHHEPWAAVGQTISNGNSGSLISWSNHYMDYGPWAEGVAGGEVDRLPDHNCSYKRAHLLVYGDRLEEMMVFDEALHADLRARGLRFYLQPRARTQHVNVSRRRSWLDERFSAGRAYAAKRVRIWPWRKRILYAAGAPLIPAVRLARIARDVRRTGRGALLPRLLPTVAAGLLVSAAGEWAGYVLGEGGARFRMYRYELERAAHVGEGELRFDAAGHPGS
jgi:hypothetical protein